MREWAAKRFYEAVTVAASEGGYAIHLDQKPVRTPAKAPLAVPTRPLADHIAAEWDAQGAQINPDTMPATRMANSALDKVGLNRAAVVEMLGEYGETDLLCYRATGPEALVALQERHWSPPLDWARDHLGAYMRITTGVMPVAQEADSLAMLKQQLHNLDDFELAAMHDLIALSGSLILALAVSEGQSVVSTAWDASRIDEMYQISQWGEDDEATAAMLKKKAAFEQAAEFLRLVRTSNRA